MKKTDFYNYLNYSLGNEDWHVERQALQIVSGDRVLCVTASGDRPLHLLTTDCSEIISLDMNKVQNYLLELKLVAISKLDFEKYLAFLGCVHTPHRYTIFKEIKNYLSTDAANFWEYHKKMVVRGILYQGITERLINKIAKMFKLIAHNKVSTLFSFKDIDEQRDYVQKNWDTFVLRKMFELIGNPKITKWMINDPGLNSFVDATIHPGKYIYHRMIRYLNHNLANKSVFLQLLLTEKINPEAYFPYLTYDGYTKIRKAPERLRYYTSNVIDYLQNNQNQKIDSFSMSDIASYMSQATFDELLKAMYGAANQNARFCLREFMSKHKVPNELKSKFRRNFELEHKLEHEESHFIYRFLAGTIHL